jgi:hypothetical protein
MPFGSFHFLRSCQHMTTPDMPDDSTQQSRVPPANGAWIKMRTNLWDDPRVASLCDAMGCDESRVCGGLFRLWSLADTHSTDGRLQYSATALNRKVGIDGFAEALQAVGWLVSVDGLMTLPRFDEHNGGSAKRRSQEAVRKANQRRRHETKTFVTPACGQERDTSVSKSKKHEQEKHAYNTHASMQHESFKIVSMSGANGSRICMTKIYSEHVSNIVRQCDGSLFSEYFTDAVNAGWAKDCEVDRVKMAALFHQVARNKKAKNPGAVICKSWQNRDSSNSKLRLKLSQEDEDFGRLLLQPKPRDALPCSIVRIQSPVDDFDESAIAKQQHEKQRQQAELHSKHRQLANTPPTRRNMES